MNAIKINVSGMGGVNIYSIDTIKFEYYNIIFIIMEAVQLESYNRYRPCILRSNLPISLVSKSL